MNDLAWVACKVLRIANHAVIKTRANGNQNIGVLHGHIGFIGAVHTEHAHKLGAGTRKTAKAH